MSDTESSKIAVLDSYYDVIQKLILNDQNSITGLLPASKTNDHSWVRDNVYSITSVWALSLAYKKCDFTTQKTAKKRAHILEYSTVKCMRGLLCSMMTQRDRLERFKESFSPADAIHAKFSSKTGLAVVGDYDWGHLQIDAISVYLLMLAQMTKSGLVIIYTTDEVDFIQNLVFSIETVYCTPDYGIWERGDKTNTGILELNASSIGMAKAAMESLNEFDLFCGNDDVGNSNERKDCDDNIHSSVIHVMTDGIEKCRSVLETMLPRESRSKETDAALLTVVGYPAFAIQHSCTIKRTMDEVLSKLSGKYGCKRFLRDGYKNPREDTHRPYYNRHELRMFEHIECEWPLFYCFMFINASFNGDIEECDRYKEILDKHLVNYDGLKVLPELYAVPIDKVDGERSNPGSQKRIASGRVPFVWAHSMYIIGMLLYEHVIDPSDLDPLNRRRHSSMINSNPTCCGIMKTTSNAKESTPLSLRRKSSVMLSKNGNLSITSGLTSVGTGTATGGGVSSSMNRCCYYNQTGGLVVQIVLLARNDFIKELLIDAGVSKVKTICETNTVEVHPSRVLSHLYTYLGRNDKLELSGRRFRDVGILATSSLYKINFHHGKNKILAFIPQRMDAFRNYMDCDIELMISSLESQLNYLSSIWYDSNGKLPTCTLIVEDHNLENNGIHPAMMKDLRKLMTGFINETRVKLVTYEEVLETSDIKNLSIFLSDFDNQKLNETSNEIEIYLQHSSDNYLRRDNLQHRKMSALTNVNSFQFDEQLSNSSPPSTSLSSHLESLASDESSIMSSNKVCGVSRMRRSTKGSIRKSRKASIMGNANVQSLFNTSTSQHFSSRAVLNDMEDSDVNIDLNKIASLMASTSSLCEQGDILHHLVQDLGMDAEVPWHSDGKNITLRQLIKALYLEALAAKNWSILRHTAGFLGKSLDELSTSVADLLVMQKQVTVGFPPNEVTISDKRLTSTELRKAIRIAYKDESSFIMITQEILIYLGQFIRSESDLFHGMMRLRIGLIICVMASELGLSLKHRSKHSTNSFNIIDQHDFVIEEFIRLSPCDMRNLLHHIMSGTEFGVIQTQSTASPTAPSTTQSNRSKCFSSPGGIDERCSLGMEDVTPNLSSTSLVSSVSSGIQMPVDNQKQQNLMADHVNVSHDASHDHRRRCSVVPTDAFHSKDNKSFVHHSRYLSQKLCQVSPIKVISRNEFTSVVHGGRSVDRQRKSIEGEQNSYEEDDSEGSTISSSDVSSSSSQNSKMGEDEEMDLSSNENIEDVKKNKKHRKSGGSGGYKEWSWMRRRRLDGALNRVPTHFYSKVWSVLERSSSLAMRLGDNSCSLHYTLTQEMTSGEMKFALRVEETLNSVSVPEFRQLMVEALVILSMIVEFDVVSHFGPNPVQIDNIVRVANRIFLEDQIESDGDATLCCATEHFLHSSPTTPSLCGATASICRHFYDSAPSGPYGTMSYLIRASSRCLDALPKEGHIACPIS